MQRFTQGGSRSRDLLLTGQMLYQLSYLGMLPNVALRDQFTCKSCCQWNLLYYTLVWVALLNNW